MNVISWWIVFMKVRPDDSWRWFFDAGRDRMMLDLANGTLFCSRFPKKALIPDAFTPSNFSVDDAASFFVFAESCSHCELDNSQRMELVLNALVVTRFLKPLMPKSWYFTQHSQYINPELGDLVTVNVSETNEEAILIVVETGDAAALCALAQPRLSLAGKYKLLGEPIKIMHDRLKPYRAKARLLDMAV